jgi:hypothetical protein
MRQLMGQEVFTAGCSRRILVCVEKDIVPGGKRLCINLRGYRRGIRTGMHPDITKIGSETGFKEIPGGRRKGLASSF